MVSDDLLSDAAEAMWRAEVEGFPNVLAQRTHEAWIDQNDTLRAEWFKLARTVLDIFAARISRAPITEAVAGWQLVPVDLTPVMVHEYCELFNRHGLDAFVNLRLVWPKLLAASPAHPLPQGEAPAARDFWLHYDHQVGRWCVENEPPKVIRTGAEVIHTREVAPQGEAEPADGGPAPAVSEAEVDAMSVELFGNHMPGSNERCYINYRFEDVKPLLRRALEAAQRARK